MPKRLLFVLPVLGFVALATLIADFMLSGKDPKAIPSALIDLPVPEFTLPSIDGEADSLTTKHFAGQVSVLNVFASWCIPCRAEHPQVTRLGALPGVALFGLNYKDEPAKAKAWLDQLGDPYRRIGADRSGRASIEWGVYGVPETFVVDAAGRIRYKHVGPIMPQDVDAILAAIEEAKR